MMRVGWTTAALDDIEAIRAYIAQDAPDRAADFVSRIFDRADSLVMFPLSGRLVPELNDERTRELIVRPYRLLYEVVRDRVEVIAVIHGARDLPQVWRDRFDPP